MAASLRVIFCGTPAFAVAALSALLASPHQLVAVYTQPDRPAGRGLQLTASPVKQFALQHALPVYQPTTLKGEEEQALLAALKADVMVVAAYGLLLPAAVLAIPPYGCLNIHPSLLPRWRGAAPIERTILAGDVLTGVTIMQMDTGLDTGPILLQRSYRLAAEETAQTLHDQLAALGADALIDALNQAGRLQPQAQDHRLATYAHKIVKEEALLDWTQPALLLGQTVRAFHPKPVAYTYWQGKILRIWRATPLQEEQQAAPGVLVRASRAGIDVATGSGILRLLQLQLSGGSLLSAADFYNARQKMLVEGQLFI